MKRYVVGHGIDKSPLKLVSGRIVLGIQGTARYIELLSVDSHHSIFISFLKYTIVEPPVSPGVEVPFLLPAHLTDLVGRRCPVIQILLQDCQFLGIRLPYEIAGGLRSGLEISKRHQFRLVELYDGLLSFHIAHPEYSPGITLVPDMQNRLQDKVAPPPVVGPGSGSIIAVVLDVESILLEHVLHLVILDPLPLRLIPGIIIGGCPLLAVPVCLRKELQIHFRSRLVLTQGKQPADFLDD